MYIESLLREIAARKAFLCQCTVPSTLYVGGGTPSLCSPQELERVVRALQDNLSSCTDGEFCGFEEFTLEVNPDDVTPQYAAGLQSLGVNRVSMGVQSFSDEALRWMNRRHSAACAVRAFEILRQRGFDNISIDLIFGYNPFRQAGGGSREKDLMQIWQRDLETAVSLAPEHISAYQMGIEEGSTLGEMVAASQYTEPAEDMCADQYEMLQDVMAREGYLQYEVSNFAREGRQSRHNSGYWNRHPYIGLGPAAHSFDGYMQRTWNTADLDAYLDYYSEQGGSGLEITDSETLSPEDIFAEELMLGLRKVDGLDISQETVRPFLDMKKVSELERTGLLVRDGDRLLIPASGLFVSDSVIRTLL